MLPIAIDVGAVTDVILDNLDVKMLSTSDMLVDALQSLDIGSTMTLAPGHSQSLVEFSEHDPRLVTSLISPLDPVLTQELVKATENVVPISTMLQPSTQVLATSPAPVHLLPIWKSFDLFVAHLVRNSNVSVAVIAFALIILDRLKEKLPVSTQGKPTVSPLSLLPIDFEV